MNLYIYNYNNYYNREFKKAGDTIEAYDDFRYYGPVQGVYGFTPGNGVNTTLIIGTSLSNYDGKGDYLIAHDPYTNKIDSRWFIIESTRTRDGQWSLTLHRDLIVDFYDDVVNAPMFIEKATLPSNNPLIFNKEGMTVNQIKTKETLLKDKSGCPWIIGYYAKNTPVENLSGQVNTNSGSYDIYINLTYEDWKSAYTSDNNIYLEPNSTTFYVEYKEPVLGIDFITNSLRAQFSYYSGYIGYEDLSGMTDSSLKINSYNLHLCGDAFKYNRNLLQSNINKLLSKQITGEQFSQLKRLEGRIIKFSDGTYKSIKLNSIKSDEQTLHITSNSELFNVLSNIIYSNPEVNITQAPNNDTFEVKITRPTYSITYTEYEDLQVSWSIAQDRYTTIDAPYDIFAIPYGQVTINDTNTQLSYTSSSDVLDAYNIATSMIRLMGSNLYDIQLLPYCPLYISETGEIDLNSSKQYSLIQQNGNVVSYIINVDKSRFTTDIYLDEPITISNVKLESECDFCKLCSPNWASEFQFTPAKNGGVEYFNVDCEYKPYQPYIHINPNFNLLYGKDWNDARGLILSGDFSLTQISDQWQQYQINNKNYQVMFDRQVQNMEIQHDIAREQDLINSIAGTLTGVAAGALAGQSVLPGKTGLGGAAGGMAGALVSGIAGMYDMKNSSLLRAEAIDYTVDNFGYLLGNIKALPYTLTKVSSFNNNNKLFPVLEYYTCTQEEKDALANKIAWNGMTVMAIGKISDYINNYWSYNGIESKGYIKGKIIRLHIPDSFDIVEQIANELNKGVFIR